MSGDPDTRDPARPLRREFSLTISAAHRRAAGNPTALKALAGIERRAAAARQHALDLHHTFKDRWEAKEAFRIWNRHVERSGKLQAPDAAKLTVDEKELMKNAARNIRVRTNRRLSKINDIKTRMSNAVMRNLGSPSLSESFDVANQVVGPQRDGLTKPARRRRR